MYVCYVLQISTLFRDSCSAGVVRTALTLKGMFPLSHYEVVKLYMA